MAARWRSSNGPSASPRCCPDDCLLIALSADDDPDQRAVTIHASGPLSQTLLAALRAEMQAWDAPGGQE